MPGDTWTSEDERALSAAMAELNSGISASAVMPAEGFAAFSSSADAVLAERKLPKTLTAVSSSDPSATKKLRQMARN